MKKLIVMPALAFMFLSVGKAEAQELMKPFEFNCRDYVSTDNARAPQSAFQYDDDANTFTINGNPGDNNISFGMSKKEVGNVRNVDNVYFIPNDHVWMAISGTNLSVDDGKAYLWWWNGLNENSEIRPTTVVQEEDGTTVFLWNVKEAYSSHPDKDIFDNPQLILTSCGKWEQNFNSAIGLTAAEGTEATVTDICYKNVYEVAIKWPQTIESLGYTSETMTAELKAAVERYIDEAEDLIPAPDSPLRKAIDEARECISSVDNEGYPQLYTHYETLPNLIKELRYTDITADYVKNPSFEEGPIGEKVVPNGWDFDRNTYYWYGVNKGGGNGDPVATDGDYVFGVWDGSNTITATIGQEITLPRGKYRLTVDMQATHRNNNTRRVGNQRLFADENVAYFKDQITMPGVGDTYPMQTIFLDFEVTEPSQTLSVGVATDGAPAETWFKIDNFRLYSERFSEDITVAFSAEYGTMILPFEAGIPEGMKVYSVTSATGKGVLNLEEKSTIAANTPYIIRDENTANSEFTFKGIAYNTQDVYTAGMLTGVLKDTQAPQNSYVLQKQDVLGFYKVASDDIIVGKYHAYLTDNTGELNVGAFIFDMQNGGTTTVKAVAAEDATVDVYSINGILVRKGVKAAQALNGLQKGLYIVNGVKKAVK